MRLKSAVHWFLAPLMLHYIIKVCSQPTVEKKVHVEVNRVVHLCKTLLQRWHLSLFEKVILVNTFMLLGEALAGLWVTSHNLEAHHYLIDTSFIVLATLITLLTNIFLLRMSFLPLFGLLSTMRAVSAGKTQTRAQVTTTDSEIGALAQTFNNMLDSLEALRREQTMQILQAQEDERRRLALELHDETGQNLTALLIHTEILHQSLQLLPESGATKETRQRLEIGLEQLTQLTQHTLEDIRVLAQQLRPAVLDDLGLLAAFRWLVEDSLQRLHLEIDLRVVGMEEAKHLLPPAYETALFRIAQESLTNIARHAHTQKASITLQRDQQQVCLQIHDDGCGYSEIQHHSGSGLIGMRERTTQLKGTLTIQSQAGQGTTIQVRLPLPT
jgi:two-component system, NarL family, sensor histidine kinase UhpB